jgi:hypothetical protein
MIDARRLAAILAVDVAGYSRLMELDEAGTFERLKTRRIELVEPAIAVHRGRIIKCIGDGSIIEFRSVVDAVNCAIEVQGRWSSATPRSRQTSASSSASAFILATWLRRAMAISWETASISPLAYRVWRSPERSTCRSKPTGR